MVALPDGTVRARTKKELRERASSVAVLRRIASGSSSLRGQIEGNPGSRGILEMGLPVVPLLVEHCNEEPKLAEIAVMLLGDELPTESTTSLKEKAVVLKAWWAEIGSKDPRFRSYVPPAAAAAAPRWPLALGSGLAGLLLGFILAALVFRRKARRA